jgi:hypothetical protein
MPVLICKTGIIHYKFIVHIIKKQNNLGELEGVHNKYTTTRPVKSEVHYNETGKVRPGTTGRT